MSSHPSHSRSKGVQRLPLAWGTVLLAGCMGVSPRQTSSWRYADPHAPLGAQDQIETHRLPDPTPQREQPLTRVDKQPLNRPAMPIAPHSAHTPRGRIPSLEPEVALPANELELQVEAPQKKQVGGHVTYKVLVRNSSERTVTGIAVRCQFEAPLQFPGSELHEVVRRIDQLLPGESKEFPLSLTSRETGSHCCRFTVTRKEGERSIDAATRSVCVDFVARQLDIELIGPTRRTEGSRAEFNLTLSNRSVNTLNDVRASLSFDQALIAREASAGAKRETGKLSWDLGTLRPMESVMLQVDLECESAARRACVTLDVQAAEFAPEQEESCVEIVAVPGTLDLRVKDRDDPLEVGKTGVYEVTVHNIGLQPARKLALSTRIPEQVRVIGAVVKDGDFELQTKFEQRDDLLIFDVIDTLAADGVLTCTIEVEALRSGTAEFEASLTTSLSTTPITAAEPTSIQEP